MKVKNVFLNEASRELNEKSLTDSELTKTLLQESMNAGNYKAAMVFAANLAQQMPNSYVPIHAKCAVLLQTKDLGEVGLCLAGAAEQFGDDPNYIVDRLAYTIEVMGTAAAKKYLNKISSKPAYESREFLELCARIYYAEGDERLYIECLYILHKQYNSEKARFLLALKSIEHERFAAALKWFVAVINGYSGSPEYFMALAGRCSLLKLLGRDNWKEETQKAANEIDFASTIHINNMWLRSISAGLWEILGETENVEYNQALIAELERYAENPAKYMQETQEKSITGLTRK